MHNIKNLNFCITDTLVYFQIVLPSMHFLFNIIS